MESRYLFQIYRTLFEPSIKQFTVSIGGKQITLKKESKKQGLRAFSVPGLLFIEQNSKKKTKWAALARKGVQIMWVIDVRRNKYIARIMNGKLKRLRDFA